MKVSSKFLKVLINPWLIAMVVTLFGLSFTLIPRDIYTSIINERNYMYINVNLIIYVTSCLGLFILVGWITTILVRSKIKNSTILDYQKYKTNLWVSKVLLAFCGICNLFLFLYLQSSVGISVLLRQAFSGSASATRLQISDQIADGKFGWLPAFTVASLVWGLWVLLHRDSTDLKEINKSDNDWLLWMLTIAIYTLVSLLTLTRGPLFEMALSLTIVYILYLVNQPRFNLGRLARNMVLISFLLGSLFIGINQLRSGGINSSQQENTALIGLMGYTGASYNRLAAVMNGTLIYPNSGVGFYTTQGFWDTPLISEKVYSIGREYGIKLPENARENWLNQFIVVIYSGLRPGYIWSTAFGFAFSDWGWGGIIYFGLTGALVGIIYCLFTKRQPLGIILYPYIVNSILGWGTAVTLAQRNFTIYLFVALAVLILKAYYKKSLNVKLPHFYSKKFSIQINKEI